jgi:two-component system OmpR family response regulator
MRILIVEDEQHLAVGLRFNFEQEGHEVDIAGNGRTALSRLQDAAPPFDLVVLDLMLPGMSGYEVCQTIRADDQELPILVLSSRPLAEDRAHAFDCGADQYLTKPFSLDELLSRVNNLLRRRQRTVQSGGAQSGSLRAGSAQSGPTLAGAPPLVELGEATIDFPRFQVRTPTATHELTTLEAQLLAYFVAHEGLVLSRRRLLAEVWEQSAAINSRSIDNFVLRLRKMIEPDPAAPRHLLSVRGTGYRFVR